MMAMDGPSTKRRTSADYWTPPYVLPVDDTAFLDNRFFQADDALLWQNASPYTMQGPDMTGSFVADSTMMMMRGSNKRGMLFSIVNYESVSLLFLFICEIWPNVFLPCFISKFHSSLLAVNLFLSCAFSSQTSWM
jgi:hypothetical protein